MPTPNPQQPRDREGRFGQVPPHPPTAAPRVPRVGDNAPVTDAERSFENALGDLLGRMFERYGAPRPGDDPDNLRHRPDAHRSDEAAWARTYHLRFRHFHRRTIDATKELFRARPSQMDPEDRKVVFQNWVNEISDTYGMERPAFYWDEAADMGGGGFYRPADHSITMSPNHPSVVTLIHETRHALQRKQCGAPMITQDPERDARAWSLSLYYKVRPNLFKRLVRERRIFHIDPTVFDEPAGTAAPDEPGDE